MNKRINKKKLNELLKNNTKSTFDYFCKIDKKELNSLKIIQFGEGLVTNHNAN